MSRRSFLRNSSTLGLLAAGAVGGVPLLAACGADEGSAGGSNAFDVKLPWIANTEYAGLFVAEHDKLYADAGLRPNFIPGGPNSAVIPLVASRKALVGIEAIPENVANAIHSGSKIKMVGALLQRSPECWVSLSSAPITQPKDIEGKRLGITLAGKNTALVFMKQNGVDTSKVELVPIQFDPAPLVAGEIDALWGLASNQPVSLEQQGHPATVMPLADYGFNRMQNVIMVTEETLADDKAADRVRTFLEVSQDGWAKALADPAKAAQVTVDKYGKDTGLKVEDQTKSLEAMKPFIERPAGDTHPQFWMTDELIAQTIESLGFIDIKADPSMFTNELLK
ncbi:ABC transporter substrate-binding protein [Nocardioides albidus]|nr:ABC transporter substrate-binding protein [Nocardioides albidus]